MSCLCVAAAFVGRRLVESGAGVPQRPGFLRLLDQQFGSVDLGERRKEVVEGGHRTLIDVVVPQFLFAASQGVVDGVLDRNYTKIMRL